MSVAVAKLKAYVESFERLAAEKAIIATDIAELMKAAKKDGFNAKAIQRLLQERQDPDEATKVDIALASYREALGQLADTPLGKAAEERDFGQVLAG